MKLFTSALAAGILLAASLPLAASAQVYSTLYDSTQPIKAGDTVRGMLLYQQGFTGLGDIRVTGYAADDMTTYWGGTFNGGNFVYDPYSGFWKPAPVSYEHATLDFSGKQLEGWVRSFNGRLDRDVFYGRDGQIYKRINITKKHKANGRVRRRVFYTYFVNLATMQRSDGVYTSFYGKNEAEQILLKNQIAAQEAALAREAAANPAFPKWQSQNPQAPAPPVKDVVAVPAQPTEEQQKSLAELITEQTGYPEIGPMLPNVGPQQPKS